MGRGQEGVRDFEVRVEDKKNIGPLGVFTKYFGVNIASLKLGIKILLVAFSLASAHYSGFMSHLPFELVSIVAVDLLPGFISVFVFYFVLSYSIARVFAFGISQFYTSVFHGLAAFVLYLRRRWPNKFGRAGIRMYKETIYYEPIFYWFFCILILLVVFNIAYLKFDYSTVSVFSMVLIVGMVCALIFKAGFLARSPMVVAKRLFSRDRVALKRSVLKAFLYFLTGGALVLSFYAGHVRFEKLMGEDEVLLDVGRFSQSVNIIMSSNGLFVSVDQKVKPEAYYFVGDGLIIKVQSKNEGGAEGGKE